MPAQPTELETYFLELVNTARAEEGIPLLTFDDELMVAADDHSAWMDATDTVSHTGADGSSPEDRITAAGYEATGTGENISFFSGTDETGATAAATTHFVEELHEGFMNSSDHYQNLVNRDFQDVGISLIEGDYQGNPAVFVTQDFGTLTMAAESDDIFIG